MTLLSPLQLVGIVGLLVGNVLAGVAVALDEPAILFVGMGVMVLGLLPVVLTKTLDRLTRTGGRAA